MKASKRRNYLKRTLAFISALSIIGSFSQTIGAMTSLAEEVNQVDVGQIPVVDTTYISNENTTATYSRIAVDISNQCDFEKAIECTVKIFKEAEDKDEPVKLFMFKDPEATDENSNISYVDAEQNYGLVDEVTLQLTGKKASGIIATEHLATGKYYVEVNAQGFQKFEQEIKIEEIDMIYTVKATLGFHYNHTYADVFETDVKGNVLLNDDDEPIKKIVHTVNHPGVLKIGDVNGDGDITARDRDLLLEVIDYSLVNGGSIDGFSIDTTKNDKSLDSDLNHDGRTDLADLTLFTKHFLDTYKWSTVAQLEKDRSQEYLDAIAKNAKSETTEGTVIKVADGKEVATLKDLLNNTGDPEKDENTLQLETADGEEISIDNPVEIAWSMDEGMDLQVLNVGIDALEGEVIIETVNEDDDIAPSEFSKPTEESSDDYVEYGDDDVEYGEDDFSGEQIESKDEDKVDTLSDFEEYEEHDAHDENTIVVPFGSGLALSESDATAEQQEGGISVNLGAKIAVKKITIKITKAKNTNLVEIGTVEFLNGMEEHIPEPPIVYPINIVVTQDSKAKDIYAAIEATWEMEEYSGITGYDFEVSTSSATKADGSFASPLSGLDKSNVVGGDKKSCHFRLESQHGNFKLIKTNTTYYVHIRATGDGGYKSSWSESAKITTKSFNRPDKPDYVSAKGEYKSIVISWGGDKTNATKSYDVYYKEEGAEEYECIKDVKGQSCTVTSYGKDNNGNPLPMKDQTRYEVYVVAKNENGNSPNSDTKIGETTLLAALPQMPKYNVINMDENANVGSTHIISATHNGGGKTVGNEKDANGKNTAWAAVDGDFTTYYEKSIWDDGGYNGMGSNGVTVTFDDEYEIGSIGITRLFNLTNYGYIRIKCWDENGNQIAYFNHSCTVDRKVDKNNQEYRIINFPHSVKAKKIQIAMANSVASGKIVISELYFYAADKIHEEIMDLYTDELHLAIRDDVTQEDVDYYRYAVRDAVDPISGETNPNKEYLLKELDTIEEILQAKHISKVIKIHSGITTVDTGIKGRNYDGLNAWQPLGAVTGKDTEVVVYVGCYDKDGNPKKTGQTSELKLIPSQYNSESNGVTNGYYTLKYGINRIPLTALPSCGYETGGSLYIQYQGAADSTDTNYVRVAGANTIPMLDIYGVTDKNECYARAAEYIEELDDYVDNIQKLHEEFHATAMWNGKKNNNLARDYDKATCILGATEILDDTMMYSLPAAQVLSGLGKGSVESRAKKLINSMDSMEDMMNFFYQHKGISPDATDAVDRTPSSHFNIRYQRMFAGAFMYAASNHIGIQYGSASGMVNCGGVKADDDGKYVSGSYFGWGIAHEIGHCLNDSNYTVAEITNNYFALLAQSQDSNRTSRLNYDNVFAKVTSGTKGSANQATQLGMYWQLHLAYDNDYNYKTYNSNEEIFDNLFYARMDTYSRNPSKAPGNLKLDCNSDQKLMRLACAAAGKNVLEFFERWGKTPDSDTLAYASNFGKEKRAIMYANEDSRVYAMTHSSSLVQEDGSMIKAINKVDVTPGTGSNANKVTLTINVSDKIKSEDILGYEIYRCTISNGYVTKTPIAFSKGTTFVDTVTSYNNRTVSYEVSLIDQHLNRSDVYATDMVKVSHDGSLDKTHWSISSTNLSAPDLPNDGFECDQAIKTNSSVWAIDDKLDTIYAPKATGNTAEIIMDFNQSLTVTGLKYTAGNKDNSIGDYKIFVKDDTTTDSSKQWIEVASGKFNGSGVAYFSNEEEYKYISTYDTTAVKLQINNQNNKTFSIAELDVLGVSGDNVDFLRAGEKAEAAFGYLAEDYKYGDRAQDYIPAGSLVFTGSYKGHPIYNVAILYDERGQLVGRKNYEKLENDTEDQKELEDAVVNQIIMADVPDGAMITNVSQGTWVYWVEPDQLKEMYWPEKIRVELYRVNDLDMNGQRIVSDSLFETLAPKDKMGSITLSGGKQFDTTESPVTDGDE